jgi:MFS family permease
VWGGLLYSDGEERQLDGGGVPLEETVWAGTEGNGRRVLPYRHGWASNRREFVAACITVLLNNVGYSVVLPSLWFRMQALGGSEAYLGLSVALFSLGQVLGASLLNRLFVYRPRHLHLLLVGSLVLLAAAELSYALSTEFWILLLARFCSGVGTGNQEVLQSHVTLITKPSLRASRVGQMSFVATLSFFIGPRRCQGVPLQVSLLFAAVAAVALVAAVAELALFERVTTFSSHPGGTTHGFFLLCSSSRCVRVPSPC